MRQLSIDQLDNEGRRVSIYDKGTPEGKTPMFQRTISMPGVHKRVIHELLRPRQWKPNHEDRRFMLSVSKVSCSVESYRVAELGYHVCTWHCQPPVVPKLAESAGNIFCPYGLLSALVSDLSMLICAVGGCFLLQAEEIVELCDNAEKLFKQEKSVLELRVRAGLAEAAHRV